MNGRPIPCYFFLLLVPWVYADSHAENKSVENKSAENKNVKNNVPASTDVQALIELPSTITPSYREQVIESESRARENHTFSLRAYSSKSVYQASWEKDKRQRYESWDNHVLVVDYYPFTSSGFRVSAGAHSGERATPGRVKG